MPSRAGRRPGGGSHDGDPRRDRLAQKELLVSLGAVVPPYHPVAGRTDLLDGLDRVGLPAMLKARYIGPGGGGGHAVLRDEEDLERAWQRLGDLPLILEAFVSFDAEYSLTGERAANGGMRFRPLLRTVHDDGSTAPGRPGLPDAAPQDRAERIMRRLLDRLDYRGEMAMCFFERGDELLCSGFFPRPGEGS